MPRLHQSEIGLDTGMFSVHQMHPEVALRLGISVGLGGLGRQGRGLQSMITSHGTALVVVSTEVDYLRPLTFFSATSIVTDSHISLRDDGKLLTFHVRHSVGGEDAIAVRFATRPVAVSGGPALDAVPGPVDSQVRALFAPDEIVPKRAAPTRYLKAQVQRWVMDAEQVGEGTQPLLIGRNDCELADQWLYARLPSLVATAREQLLFDGAADLSVCLSRPITRFQGEFFRPMYFGDHGRIEVKLYRRGEQTFAVHRVLGERPPGGSDEERPLCALAVETF